MKKDESTVVDPTWGEVVHEVDGILECDNRLPRWWLLALFGTMLFAGGYWFWYHGFAFGTLPRAQYEDEMAEAAAVEAAKIKALRVLTDDALVSLSKDRKTVAEGKEVFHQTCAACHREDGSGNIGPNLTDKAWIHGSGPLEIFATVSAGAPDKGMPAWSAMLGRERTQSVVAYVLTIKNTGLPGKAPQGVVAP